MKDKWNLNQLANMLNQEEARLKQLEQHSVHLVSQRAQRKWRKPKKKAESMDHKRKMSPTLMFKLIRRK
jgi:hypothetical protein